MTKRLYKLSTCVIVFLLMADLATGCAVSKTQEPVKVEPAPVEQPVQKPEEKPSPVVENKDISLYMPMKVGYIWQYEGEGNEYAAYTLRVEFQEGNRYQLTRDNGGTVLADIYEVREDSIVHVYLSGENYDHKNLLKEANNLEDTILKLPIQAGNKWISEENSYEIIDTQAVITVPYGTFKDCIVVKRTYKDGSEDYMYYKDGVGLLQSEFRSGDMKVISKLKNFSSK